jgi:hypothetical protein
MEANMADTIRFQEFRCIKAEAVFGDHIDITFGGDTVWSGTVNSNRQYQIATERPIPEGDVGAKVRVYQSYVGQPEERVLSKRVRRSSGGGQRTWEIEADHDGDPGGEYELSVIIQ